MAVYKEAEFHAFLRLIDDGQIQHWVQIATIVGVDKNTISAWKKLPEAQEAIAAGISKSLIKMELTGNWDWRMHQAKLRMLGISEKVRVDAEIVPDLIRDILRKYGINNDNENSVD